MGEKDLERFMPEYPASMTFGAGVLEAYEDMRTAIRGRLGLSEDMDRQHDITATIFFDYYNTFIDDESTKAKLFPGEVLGFNMIGIKSLHSISTAERDTPMAAVLDIDLLYKDVPLAENNEYLVYTAPDMPPTIIGKQLREQVRNTYPDQFKQQPDERLSIFHLGDLQAVATFAGRDLLYTMSDSECQDMLAALAEAEIDYEIIRFIRNF
jgi:hypothetical protein